MKSTSSRNSRVSKTYSESEYIFTKRFEDALNVAERFLQNKQYKSAIKMIESELENFNENKIAYYLLFDIQMKCYFKIIVKKLYNFKYYKEHSSMTLKNKNKLHSLEKIFSRIQKIFEKEIPKFGLYKEDISFIAKEKFIQDFSEALLLQSQFSYFKREPQDSISYLTIGFNILTQIINFCKDNYTLILYEKTALMISKLLIEDNCFNQAIDCLKLCLKASLKNIGIWLVTKDMKIFINEQIPKELCLTIINIAICFYQIGICHENLDERNFAIKTYRNSQFFFQKFWTSLGGRFFKIGKETADLAEEYYNQELEKQERLEKMKKKKMLYSYSVSHLKTKRQEDLKEPLSNEKLKEKFSSLQNYLSNRVKFQPTTTPVTVNSFSYSISSNRYLKNGMMNSVILYNDLLSENYQEFLKSTTDLNFNNCSRDTERELEKYNLQLMHGKNKKNKVKEVIPNHKKKKVKVEKYKVHNDFTFTKKYKENFNQVDKLYYKELSFQKKLLKLKHYENSYSRNLYEPKEFDKAYIEKDVDDRYKIIRRQIEEEIQKKLKKYVSPVHNVKLEKLEKEKKKLIRGVLVSLNSEKITKIKEIEKRENVIKKEINMKNLSTNSSYFSTSNNNIQRKNTGIIDINKQVLKKNNEILNKLNNDIFMCEKAKTWKIKNIRKPKRRSTSA